MHKVSAPVTLGAVVSSATVWTLYDDREQTLKAVLSAVSFAAAAGVTLLSKGSAVAISVQNGSAIPVPTGSHGFDKAAMTNGVDEIQVQMVNFPIVDEG